MTSRTAEGRMCEICRRRLLAGETFSFFDDPVHRKHRRPVCALCQRQARERGWTRTVELPPPVVLPSVPETEAFPEQSTYDAGEASQPPEQGATAPPSPRHVGGD